MKQISIFSFDPQTAAWKEAPWSDGSDHSCDVLALIPQDVLSPVERKIQRINSIEWREQQEVWSSFVYAISNAIPVQERPNNDVNGWNVACELLKASRDKKQPIKMRIWERETNRFLNTEIIDYLMT